MKKINKLLAVLLILCTILSAFSACKSGKGTEDASETGKKELTPWVDYVAQVKLNKSSGSLWTEATVKSYIDGDTTHFYVDEGVISHEFLKARYAGVNTPESTGQIEPWGKKASAYTKEKLKNSTSIVLETDGTDWEVDSTGERYLVWVWYKPQGSDVYRNLNLELLQEGLALGSSISDCRYAD